MSQSKETFKVGDLVKSNDSKVRQCGIILKKRFSHQDIDGHRFNVLTYDVLFEGGDIKNLSPDYLSVIQKLK